eukprot:COSAG02_NODE_16_length_56207_cov_9.816122_22_plen_130_part_00
MSAAPAASTVGIQLTPVDDRTCPRRKSDVTNAEYPVHRGSLILVVDISTDSLVARAKEKSLRNRLDQDSTVWEFLGPSDFSLISPTYSIHHWWVDLFELTCSDNPVRCTLHNSVPEPQPSSELTIVRMD